MKAISIALVVTGHVAVISWTNRPAIKLSCSLRRHRGLLATFLIALPHFSILTFETVGAA